MIMYNIKYTLSDSKLDRTKSMIVIGAKLETFYNGFTNIKI